MHDLRVVGLERLLAFDAREVLGKTLHMATQVCAELFYRLSGLHDLLDFFARESVATRLHLVRHHSLPDVDTVHGETERVIDKEDGAAQFEEAEVFEVQVKRAFLLL